MLSWVFQAAVLGCAPDVNGGQEPPTPDCPPAANGLLPPGSWVERAAGEPSFWVSEDGAASFYFGCYTNGALDAAAVVDGHVDWSFPVSFHVPWDTAGEADTVSAARLSGELCGETLTGTLTLDQESTVTFVPGNPGPTCD